MEQLGQFPRLIRQLSLSSFRNLSPLAKREARNGLLFISPWIIGFVAFTIIPMIATIIFTFTNIQIGNSGTGTYGFVGLKNYQTLLIDPQIPKSLWITVKFGLIALPIGILLPLSVALLVNSKNIKGTNFFRTMFYMPYIIPFVAAIFVWGGMLNPETGWINRALLALGVPDASLPGWAQSVRWVYPTYVIMGIWGIGNAMLIMLAGLQNVPTDLYDAAKVDGCNGFQVLINVTLPMISPIIFYNLVLSVVFLFQYFTTPLVVNNGNGNPQGATMFFNLYLYRNFFTYQLMGYGATMAWVLFLIILVVTGIIFATAKYWVYYASETH
jgi:multiple sugar transport system permease protein